MDEYDLDTTNLVGLDDHRDRLIALAEQCGQHDLAVLLKTPTYLTESDLDAIDGPISPLLFPIYDVASRFSTHGHAIKALAEYFEHTEGALGLADAMHEALAHATDNLPDPAVDLSAHFSAMFATVEAAITELEDAARGPLDLDHHRDRLILLAEHTDHPDEIAATLNHVPGPEDEPRRDNGQPLPADLLEMFARA
jgi:hypothetical protein